MIVTRSLRSLRASSGGDRIRRRPADVEGKRWHPGYHPQEVDPGQEYGLIIYRGGYYDNVGDEIQSLAAMQFLPRVDHLIPIDQIHRFSSPSGKRVKVIMNGYFTPDPDAWPPSRFIDPLFISFHLSHVNLPEAPYSGPNAGRAAVEVLLRGEKLRYLERAGAIGCRDRNTLESLQAAGVDAYFSGCLTLTLKSRWRPAIPRIGVVDTVVGIDELLRDVPARFDVVKETHLLERPAEASQERRLARAQELVWLYSACSLVLTSRLHCALPCVALGTPVLFIEPRHDLFRLKGLVELLNVVTAEDASRGRYRIDWSRIPANRTDHVMLRDAMVAKCVAFCGAESSRR